VPPISEFFGIVVTMYYNDHAPPHFHARYAEHEAQLEIDSLEVLHGSLPPPQLALVQAWAELYHGELFANWERARRGVPLRGIPGLESR
jgi:hypothetical protein